MFDRILVPLDGSASAEGIVPEVERIALRRTSEIVLLRVVALPSTGELLLDGPCLEAERYLDAIELRLTREGLRVRRLVRLGNFADTIVDVAKQTDSELLAMSTHGRSGLARWAFGSVTEKVIRSGTSVPIFIRRTHQPPREPKTILLPLAGAGTAVPYAVEMARMFGAKIVALHVRESSPFDLDAAVESIRSMKLPLEVVTREGDPAEQILGVPADMIAMSTHARTGVSRWILGSVTEKVLRSSPVPMLVVRS